MDKIIKFELPFDGYSLLSLALSVTVGFLVIREAIKMRKLHIEPDVIYYLKYVGGLVSGIVKNKGNGIAYNINIYFEFDDKETPEFLGNTNFVFNYIAPNQSIQLKLGHRNINSKPLGFDAHSVKIIWYYDKKNKKEHISEYRVDLNMIEYLGSSGLDSISYQLSEIKYQLKDKH